MKKIVSFMLALTFIISFSSIEAEALGSGDSPSNAFEKENTLIDEYREGYSGDVDEIDTIIDRTHVQISGLFGLFFLGSLYKFGELVTKLIMFSDNPSKRGEAIFALLFSGFCTGLLGSLTLIFGFFYHILDF